VGKREELRHLNLMEHAPKLGVAFAGVTSGWGLEWNNTTAAFYPVDLSGGGGGAPTTATYVTMSSDATLTAERVLTAGNFIQFQDGGANAAVTANLWVSGQTGGDLISMGPPGVWNRLGAGTSGYFLKTRGVGVFPIWEDVPSGAPTDAQYVTMSSDATLSDERILTAGQAMQLQDGGAGGNATLNLYKAGQAHGDILYRGSTDWLRRAAGTSGQVLTTRGGSYGPIWQSLPDWTVDIAHNEVVAGITDTVASGARVFNTTQFGDTSTWKFEITAMVSHAGITGQVWLYDVTNGETITGSTLSVTAQIPTRYQSGALSTAGGANQLKNAATAYEARMNILGVGVTNIMHCGVALMRVTI
jgi:hypothetical protein